MSKEKEGEKKTPEYITKHEKLYSHANRLADRTDLSLTEAYTKAVKEHLLDKNGNPDFEKLDDSETNKKFIETLTGHVANDAAKYFKTAKDLEEFDKKLLFQTYTGVTTTQIRDIVSRTGKNFKDQFPAYKQQIHQQTTARLQEAAGSHLEDTLKTKESILKYAGIGKKVDAGSLTIDQGRQILEAYHEHGAVTDSDLRRIVGAHRFKKVGLEGKVANDNTKAKKKEDKAA